MGDSVSDHRDRLRWESLLDWLHACHGMDVGRDGLLVECRNSPGAGKGLYALQKCPASLSIVSHFKAMINVKTLSGMYPDPPKSQTLTPVQLISLHLLLHKPACDGDSKDPTFGPFISTMPRDFNEHPLMWSVNQTLNTGDTFLGSILMEATPPSVQDQVKHLASRFWQDWKAISQYVHSKREVMSTTSREIVANLLPEGGLALDYAWAWLNVNTRCIYYQLDPSPSSPSNVTLCPILDFANHIPVNTELVPILPSGNPTHFRTPAISLSGSRPIPKGKIGGDYTFTSSGYLELDEDQEVHLCYGAHPNRKLFVEYGFVNLFSQGSIVDGVETANRNGEVEVDDLVATFFKERGSVGKWMREVLEEEGYWGDWTLHSSPWPAHPSFRLTTALRLLHLVGPELQEVPAHPERIVAPWRDVINGIAYTVSPENEEKWRDTLRRLCEHIAQRAHRGIEAIGKLHTSGRPEWFRFAKQNIRCLWQEELEVSQAVLKNLRSGEVFC